MVLFFPLYSEFPFSQGPPSLSLFSSEISPLLSYSLCFSDILTEQLLKGDSAFQEGSDSAGICYMEVWMCLMAQWRHRFMLWRITKAVTATTKQPVSTLFTTHSPVKRSTVFFLILFFILKVEKIASHHQVELR